MSDTAVRSNLSMRDRRDAITELILEHRSALAADLAQMFDVSLMTIHRDLDALADAGLVTRFHGGASALRNERYEPDVNYRLKLSMRAKREIAAAAVEHFVDPEMSLLLDDSTSSLAVAQRLGEVTPVTVLTSFLEIINSVARVEGVQLIALGGEYNPTNNSFHGAGFIAALEQLQADVLFASSAAMNANGVFHQEAEVHATKRAMMARADRKILLMDRTKLGHSALHRISSLDAWDAIVVDSAADPAEVEAARAAGATVIVAPPLG